MKTRELGRDRDGKRTVEVACNEVSFRHLVRLLKRFPASSVTDVRHDPFNDDASASVRYRGFPIRITTPFSDYWIEQSRDCPDHVFDELITRLQDCRVMWWQRLI